MSIDPTQIAQGAVSGAAAGATSGAAAAAADEAAGATSPSVETLRFVIAWAVVLMLLGLLNRSRLGHTAIYYALALMIFLLVVTQYRWFANVLTPITGKTAADYVPPTAAPAAHSWNVPQLAQPQQSN